MRVLPGGGRVRAVAALALLFSLGAASAALAHANYVRSVPEADARLARPPTEVRIVFSEPPEPRFSEITVLDVSGGRMDAGGTSRLDDLTLRVGLKDLPEGGYTVAWHVLSAVDGHETRGSFVFAVGNAPLPATPDIAAAPAPSALEIAGRALGYGGVALLFGAPFFAFAVSRDQRDRRGLGLLARAGALALLLGTALVASARPDAIAILLDSRLGRLYEARALLALVALAAPGMNALLALGAGSALSLSLQSHAAASGDVLQTVVDFAHVLGASTWAGGLVALAAVSLPRHRAQDASASHTLGALVWRFSLLGVASVALIVATGTLQSLQRLADPLDLIETDYGLALLAKILLLLAAVALAALNLLRHGPSLAAAREPRRSRRLLVLGVRGEIGLVAAIVVAAGVLTALAPPSSPTVGAAYAEVRHANGLRLELFAAQRLPGRNRFVLRVSEGLSPATDIDKVSFRFTMLEHDMGEQELVASPRARGEYVAEGSPVAMFGTWRVQAVVRRSAHEEARALFDIAVTAPAGGGGVTARVVQAGTLTVVVFSDPSLPLAGQPLTLGVVVLDRSSIPVTGARLTVDLRGQTIDGVAEAGGRYRVDLPALVAGETTLRITVSSSAGSGTAEYPLSVAP